MAELWENYEPYLKLNTSPETDRNFVFGGAVTFKGAVTNQSTVTGGLNTVTAYTTTAAVAAAQSGSIILWNSATGFTITLPTAAVGLTYSFGVQTSVTSSNHKLICAVGGFFLGGLAMGEATGSTTLEALGNGTTHLAVTMNGTTSGGLVGTFFNIYGISTTQWIIEGLVAGSGTLATPFATS